MKTTTAGSSIQIEFGAERMICIHIDEGEFWPAVMTVFCAAVVVMEGTLVLWLLAGW